MKKILLILMLFLAVTGFSQGKAGFDNIERVNAKKPTVYLEYVCQDTRNIQLRMYNNSIWHIGVWTEKSYFPTKKPIRLGNGNKGYAIPNNEEVIMYYYIEKDKLENVKKIKIPKREPYYQGGGGRIVSQDSIRFSVPTQHLKKGLKIYVQFSYEWDGFGDISKEPEHRVYFRGGDIGSANTEIEPTACKE